LGTLAALLGRDGPEGGDCAGGGSTAPPGGGACRDALAHLVLASQLTVQAGACGETRPKLLLSQAEVARTFGLRALSLASSRLALDLYSEELPAEDRALALCQLASEAAGRSFAAASVPLLRAAAQQLPHAGHLWAHVVALGHGSGSAPVLAAYFITSDVGCVLSDPVAFVAAVRAAASAVLGVDPRAALADASADQRRGAQACGAFWKGRAARFPQKAQLWRPFQSVLQPGIRLAEPPAPGSTVAPPAAGVGCVPSTRRGFARSQNFLESAWRLDAQARVATLDVAEALAQRPSGRCKTGSTAGPAPARGRSASVALAAVAQGGPLAGTLRALAPAPVVEALAGALTLPSCSLASRPPREAPIRRTRLGRGAALTTMGVVLWGICLVALIEAHVQAMERLACLRPQSRQCVLLPRWLAAAGLADSIESIRSALRAVAPSWADSTIAFEVKCPGSVLGLGANLLDARHAAATTHKQRVAVLKTVPAPTAEMVTLCNVSVVSVLTLLAQLLAMPDDLVKGELDMLRRILKAPPKSFTLTDLSSLRTWAPGPALAALMPAAWAAARRAANVTLSAWRAFGDAWLERAWGVFPATIVTSGRGRGAMFENLVGNLLSKFLAPYLGISVRTGKLELKNLALKKTIFAALGVDAVELERGSIKSVEVSVPLSALFAKKIQIAVHGLSVAARTQRESQRSDEDQLRLLRDSREQRVATRAGQLRELAQSRKVVDAAVRAGQEVDDKVSFAAKLTRQILGNLSVDISDIGGCIQDLTARAELGLHLDSASVRSPGPQGSPARAERATLQALSKEVSVTALSVVGGALSEARPLLKPLDLVLHLCDDPAAGDVGLRLEVGRAGGTGASVSLGQARKLAALAAGLLQEGSRLQGLLTPPGTVELVALGSAEDVERTQTEFKDLFRRKHGAEFELPSGALELADTDLWRFQLLWDVVPEESLAHWLAPLTEEMEEVAARREAEKQEKRRTSSIFGRMFGRRSAPPSDISEEAADEAVRRLREEADSLDALELPKKVSVEMLFSSFEVELLPGADKDTGSAITAKLLGGKFVTDIESSLDHRRLPSAKWSLSLEADGMSATEGDLRIVDFGAVRLGEPAAMALSLRNRLEPERTVVSVSLAFQPLEARVSHTLLPSLRRFAAAVAEEFSRIDPARAPASGGPAGGRAERAGWCCGLDPASEPRAPEPALRRSESAGVEREVERARRERVEDFLSMGEQWLQSDKGKEVLAGAQARIPDALELHVDLKGPRLRLPIPGSRELWVSPGSMLIKTPRACTTEAVELTLTFSDMGLAATDRNRLRHDVVAPFELQATLQIRPDAVEVGGRLDGLQLKASPEIAQILALAPQSALAALGGGEADAPAAPPGGAQVAPRQPALPKGPTTLLEDVAESEPSSEPPAVRREISENTRLAQVKRRAREAFLAAAHEKAQQARKGQTLQVSFQLGQSTVLLDDALMPVMRLQMASDSLEVTVNTESLDTKATLMLQMGTEVFSVRAGRFEPVLEPFKITCQVSQTVKEGQSVKVFGHRPLMLNATPTAVRQLAWYVPHLLSVLSPSLDDTEVSTAPRYRVLNLTDHPVDLGFLGAARRESARVDSHTGEWRSMDGWVLPERREQVELPGGARLGLTRSGSECVLGPDAAPVLWQLLRPQADYALLLVSPQCLLLNATSLPLRVRAAGRGAPLPRTRCAGAALLLGGPAGPPAAPARGGGGPLASQEPLVEPGEVVGLPLKEAVASPGGASTFAAAQALQSQVEVALHDGGWTALGIPSAAGNFVPVRCGQSSFLVACSVSVSAPPARVPCCWLRIVPALTWVSVLPCAMEVEYRLASEPEAAARRAEVPSMGRAAVYDVACPGKVAVRVWVRGRLWSKQWAVVGVGEAAGREQDTEAELKGEAGAILTVAAREEAQVVVHTPCWLVDRTGWGLTVQRGSPLPAFEGITLCAEQMDKYTLAVGHAAGPLFSLPSSHGRATLADGRAVCVRSLALPPSEVRGCPTRCLEIAPWLVLHNASGHPAQFRASSAGGASASVPAGGSAAPGFVADALHLQVETEDGWTDWSAPLPLERDLPLAIPLLLGGMSWTLELRPDRGMLCVLLRHGSNYTLVNSFAEPCRVRVRGAEWATVPPGREHPLGWPDPLGRDADRAVEISLQHGATIQFKPHSTVGGHTGAEASVKSVQNGLCTRIEVRPGADAPPAAPALRLELLLPRLGVSLIGEHSGGASELLYLELELLQVRLDARPDEDRQLFDLAISDMQLDFHGTPRARHLQRMRQSQPEGSRVVLGNRSAAAGAMHPVLRVVADRGSTSSPDLHLRAVRIELEELELTVDDRLAASASGFLRDAGLASGDGQSSASEGVVAKVLCGAGKSLLDEAWEVPAPQQALQVDEMRVSAVRINVWCKVDLGTLVFIPKWVRVLLPSITFSRNLSLEGSCIDLEPKDVVGERGSASDFAMSVVDEYMGDMLESLISLLGRSSLLNVPRGTLKLGGKIGSSVVQGVTGVTGRATQLMDRVSLDDAYVERQRQARQRNQIGSLQHGVTEAIGELGEGLGGVLDVVRRPVQGAREGGVGGFVEGVGKGVISSVVKPVSAVGRAVTHVGAGIAAQVGSATQGRHQQVVRVRRPPRLLAGPRGAVVEFSELEAHVASKLPDLRIEVVVPLCYSAGAPRGAVEGHPPPLLQALVLAADAVHHVEVPEPEFVARAAVSSHAAELGADLAMLISLREDAGLQRRPPPEDEQPLEAALVGAPNAGTQRAPGQEMMTEMGALEAASPPTASSSSQAPASPLGSPLLSRGASGSAAGFFPAHGDSALRVRGSATLPLLRIEFKEPAAYPGAGPRLLVRGGQSTLDVPAPRALGGDVASALLEALANVSAEGGCTEASAAALSDGDDWTEKLRRALSLARSLAVAQGAKTWAESRQICAVLEVQRRSATGGWCAPYLPTDAEQKHRWVDGGLQRKHPLLDPQRDWQAAQEPPVVMSSIWQPVGGWRVVTDERTDAEGWSYSPGWSSGSWRPSPRPVLDSVRRRRWERQYRICDIEDTSQAEAVDSSWLHGVRLSTAPTLCRRMQRCCCCCCQAVAGRASGRARRANRTPPPLQE
ncbi:unnamed protein product, partial [Prorocentrum cordatum]